MFLVGSDPDFFLDADGLIGYRTNKAGSVTSVQWNLDIVRTVFLPHAFP
jgi:hypothetical protein